MQQPNQSPVNALPPVVVALVILILGIELVFSLGGRGLIGGPQAVGWRLGALQEYGFGSQYFWWMWENGVWPFDMLKRFVTYAFVHGSFTQALFVCVFLLAMGKMVGETMGEIAVIVIFLCSAIGGALAYAVLVGGHAALIGGFPAVYGLIGGFTHLLWRSLASVGAQQHRAFSLIAFLMGVQLLFGLLFGGSPDWVADLAGFVTGFVMSFFLVPGGWARILQKLRQQR
ncbi:rhomboid family intramembrane serine protease [Phaeobacter sp. HF9A]|uniref:rhomboid family intramembrane serine protease n=1 Tax=Phaeobacter sp. HF9A TaxID=2721561 RepID=UPI001430611F|nr:rhomboid family intramembrane serine protease [Phaeobacter sp. HF9A]NIZ13947.1 rhomboid family intramembrane serine protease [Phaeobacter sp. HF9A]